MEENEEYAECCEAKDGHYYCTLDRGHAGNHEAWGRYGSTKPVHVWPQPSPSSSPRAEREA